MGKWGDPGCLHLCPQNTQVATAGRGLSQPQPCPPDLGTLGYPSPEWCEGLVAWGGGRPEC